MTTRGVGASVAPWQWSVDAGADGVQVLRLSGRWLRGERVPRGATIQHERGGRPAARVLAFDTRGLVRGAGDWRGVSVPSRDDRSTRPSERERALGREAAGEVERSTGLVEDPRVAGYIRDVARG
jgi:hypothetical protein